MHETCTPYGHFTHVTNGGEKKNEIEFTCHGHCWQSKACDQVKSTSLLISLVTGHRCQAYLDQDMCFFLMKMKIIKLEYRHNNNTRC